MVRNMDKVTGRKVAEQILTSTKETTIRTKSTAMASFSGAQEVSTKVIISMTRKKDTVRCTGSTVAFIEDFGHKACNQALVL